MWASAHKPHTDTHADYIPWLSIRNSDPEVEDDATAEKPRELEEAKKLAGSGMDLHGLLLGPRGVWASDIGEASIEMNEPWRKHRKRNGGRSAQVAHEE